MSQHGRFTSSMPVMALVTTLGVLTTLTSCLDVGQERAARDETVGIATTPGGLTIDIEGGLGTVRAIDDGEILIWGQAPVLDMTITTPDTHDGKLTLRLHNAMKDAELTIVSGPNPLVPVARQGATGQDAGVDTRHQWELELAPGTPHTVRIGPPPTHSNDAQNRWKFIIFADVQETIDHVQDLYDSMQRDPEIEFGLISGDLTEQGSREELERFQMELRTLSFPVFATLGNHELGTSETLFHELFGRGNFSFEYRGARMTLLDSASATLAPRARKWLEGWTEQAGERPHLVVMHIPILDASGKRSGAFASRQEANTVLDTLSRGGVDLLVFGHVHTYERYQLAGIPTIISGGGGSIPMRLDGIGRHYLKVEVDPVHQTFESAAIRVYPEDL